MKNCVGCKTSFECNNQDRFCLLQNAPSCPCEICIVKPMCVRKLSCIQFVKWCFYFNKNTNILREIYQTSRPDIQKILNEEGFALDL